MMLQQDFINLKDYIKLVIWLTQALSVSPSRQKIKQCVKIFHKCVFPRTIGKNTTARKHIDRLKIKQCVLF